MYECQSISASDIFTTIVRQLCLTRQQGRSLSAALSLSLSYRRKQRHMLNVNLLSYSVILFLSLSLHSHTKHIALIKSAVPTAFSAGSLLKVCVRVCVRVWVCMHAVDVLYLCTVGQE